MKNFICALFIKFMMTMIAKNKDLQKNYLLRKSRDQGEGEQTSFSPFSLPYLGKEMLKASDAIVLDENFGPQAKEKEENMPALQRTNM